MLAGLLLTAAAGLAAPGSGEVAGRCLYPQVWDQYSERVTFAWCDRVRIGGHTIDFIRNDERQMRFSGAWRGDLFEVREVTLRNGRVVEVDGDCRVEYRQGDVQNVACLAFKGPLLYGANLVVLGI